MIELVRLRRLSVNELKQLTHVEHVGNTYTAILKGEVIVFVRAGRCEEKCKGACCRFMCFENPKWVDYAQGFVQLNSEGILQRDCRYLKKGRCSRWKKLPLACQLFPTPEDIVYWKVAKKCGFKFMLIGALK